jgi:hypothetical protein
MAWIVQVAPSPRHPKTPWQVRYQQGSHERSAGIYGSPKAAETARKRINQGLRVGKRTEKRILATFGNTPFAAMDADQIGAWKASLVTDGLEPATVNTYLSLLGTILNAAVDSDYLPHSPLLRKSRAGRVGAARNLPMARREVWITRSQLDRFAEAIEPRYHALLKPAALTGLR